MSISRSKSEVSLRNLQEATSLGRWQNAHSPQFSPSNEYPQGQVSASYSYPDKYGLSAKRLNALTQVGETARGFLACIAEQKSNPLSSRVLLKPPSGHAEDVWEIARPRLDNIFAAFAQWNRDFSEDRLRIILKGDGDMDEALDLMVDLLLDIANRLTYLLDLDAIDSTTIDPQLEKLARELDDLVNQNRKSGEDSRKYETNFSVEEKTTAHTMFDAELQTDCLDELDERVRDLREYAKRIRLVLRRHDWRREVFESRIFPARQRELANSVEFFHKQIPKPAGKAVRIQEPEAIVQGYEQQRKKASALRPKGIPKSPKSPKRPKMPRRTRSLSQSRSRRRSSTDGADLEFNLWVCVERVLQLIGETWHTRPRLDISDFVEDGSSHIILLISTHPAAFANISDEIERPGEDSFSNAALSGPSDCDELSEIFQTLNVIGDNLHREVAKQLIQMVPRTLNPERVPDGALAVLSSLQLIQSVESLLASLPEWIIYTKAGNVPMAAVLISITQASLLDRLIPAMNESFHKCHDNMNGQLPVGATSYIIAMLYRCIQHLSNLQIAPLLEKVWQGLREPLQNLLSELRKLFNHLGGLPGLSGDMDFGASIQIGIAMETSTRRTVDNAAKQSKDNGLDTFVRASIPAVAILSPLHFLCSTADDLPGLLSAISSSAPKQLDKLPVRHLLDLTANDIHNREIPTNPDDMVTSDEIEMRDDLCGETQD